MGGGEFLLPPPETFSMSFVGLARYSHSTVTINYRTMETSCSSSNTFISRVMIRCEEGWKIGNYRHGFLL